MFSSRKSAAPAAVGGYTIAKSLRFRASAGASLNRTPSSAGNRQKWTWSGWVKRGLLNDQQVLFAGFVDPGNYTLINTYQDSFIFQCASASSIDAYQVSTMVLRDPAAWYHIVYAIDTTQATAANRAKMYVNGVQITSFSTNTQPPQNYNTFVNATNSQFFGKFNNNLYFDGYMAEVQFVDGQQLTPSSFGSTNAATGVWQPIAYTGTYGTNGFYLKFTDTTSTSTLGNDSSGNNNTWTVNNISLTSGATYDSMTDVPTNTSATVANYCVLNPLVTPATTTIINGNLGLSGYTAFSSATGTIGVSSGKWYFEFIAQANAMSGITGTPNGSNYPGQAANSYAWDSANTTKYNNNSGASYGSATSAGDIVGVAFDLDSGSITFYKNNVSQGTAYTFTPSGAYFPVVRNGDTTNTSVNFGQRPFSYTPPSGFVALNTFNLPTPTIGATASTQANKYFDVKLYTGNGAASSNTTQNITTSFYPDLTWVKGRDSAFYHRLTSTGLTQPNYLSTNSTDAEGSLNDQISALASTYFQVKAAGTGGTNQSGLAYVGWVWNANSGSTVTNTSGSITSTVSANTTAGFSIATYTGNGSSGATFGHGLGVAPSMIIVKARSFIQNWIVYHTSLGNTKALFLDLTDAAATSSLYWNNTSPTSSLITLGSGNGTNKSAETYVAYCFAQVAGYCAFGSYTGNGSADGPFIYTGFRPKYVLVKESSASGNNWQILDSSRDPFNVAPDILQANLSNAESAFSSGGIDFLSNGFKIRTSSVSINTNGSTIIFAAFAESPFKYANAR